ncbi:PSPB protein, partial [Poecile atricapillus]|nr:PSPB protein [Poecile atricapillus]
MAPALLLLLALLGTPPGLGAPGGGCGVPPTAWCQDWVTALRCGALGRCPHLTQGHPDMDVCASCLKLFTFLRQASNRSALEVALDKVMGIPCLYLSVVVTPCQALVRALVHHLLWQIQHLKPWQVCATLRLCRGEPGAALAVPVPGVPSTHPQGSVLAPEALPLPLPLCWLCRSLVARAE